VAEALGSPEPYERAAVRTDDGTELEGRAFPVVLVPGERLRLELRCEDHPDGRFELRSDHADDRAPVRVRQCRVGDADRRPTGDRRRATSRSTPSASFTRHHYRRPRPPLRDRHE
jgi:hypothetical protein